MVLKVIAIFRVSVYIANVRVSRCMKTMTKYDKTLIIFFAFVKNMLLAGAAQGEWSGGPGLQLPLFCGKK